MKDILNMVICGLGGQGILFMTRILAYTAMEQGLNVLGAETHGMAQRGGSVISHLRIGDVKSSLVRSGTADILLALDEKEGYRNLPFLSKGAKFFINGLPDRAPEPRVKDYLTKNSISYFTVPAHQMAMEMNAPMSSNLILLGLFSSKFQGLFGPDKMKATIKELSPERFYRTNISAFEKGTEYNP